MGRAHRRGRKDRPAHTGLVETIVAEGGASKATALGIYDGSDAAATTALYEWLATRGPAGLVATELFRAHKASGRAKEYRGRYKGAAYDRKNWALDRLCQILGQHAAALGITWGWKNDPKKPAHCWVLYVDLPSGQVSFHAAYRMGGPVYDGEWDRAERVGEFRICSYIDALHTGCRAELVQGRRAPLDEPEPTQEGLPL